ncbi:MAG: 50S ribosomal protein L10 [Treponema sp.]|nr:50S ribosomal protein L10 [Treponema sp.]
MAIVAKRLQESKTQAIGELKEALGSSEDFIFTDYRGLTVEQITALRRGLREKEVTYKVVKNSFARIAFEQLSMPDVSAYLVGPTAVAVAPKDSNEVAKILFEFAKETPALQVKGALVAGAIYDAKQTEAYSKLPGRLELISMLMSVMNGPARGLVSALNDVPSRLARTLQAVADKKGGGGSGAVESAADSAASDGAGTAESAAESAASDVAGAAEGAASAEAGAAEGAASEGGE